MKFSDEQLQKILVKNIESKTLLVSLSDVEKVKEEHLKQGWRIYHESEINGRIKITFQREKDKE